MNFINELLEILRKEKPIHHLETIFGGVDLANMQSLSKYSKAVKYLLCSIDLFSKYAWVIPLKDKRGTSIVNAFQKVILKGRKRNKIWVDQGNKIYNNSFKDVLKIILKCIQCIMKKFLLLLKDLLEL